MSHDTWTLIAARLGGRISPISVTHGNVIPLYANYRCLFTAGRTLLTALFLSFIKVKLEIVKNKLQCDFTYSSDGLTWTVCMNHNQLIYDVIK